MKKEAKALIGRHDFSAFQGSRSRRDNTIRRVRKIDVKKNGKFIYIDIESDGFLYNMARNIVGTLIDVGRGRMRPESLKEILSKMHRPSAGHTAPAKGLCLVKVFY